MESRELAVCVGLTVLFVGGVARAAPDADLPRVVVAIASPAGGDGEAAVADTFTRSGLAKPITAAALVERLGSTPEAVRAGLASDDRRAAALLLWLGARYAVVGDHGGLVLRTVDEHGATIAIIYRAGGRMPDARELLTRHDTRLRIEGPAGATFLIDGLPAGIAPLVEIAGLAPDHYTVSIRLASGVERTESIDLAAGARISAGSLAAGIDATAPADGAAGARAGRGGSILTRWWLWAAVGAAVVAVGVGVGLAVALTTGGCPDGYTCLPGSPP